ncbi:LysR family transcriptional regulator [Bordetella genomosp. 11]|uniref:LysR family transcriptional regulator n=1 Tax=Bordetella genomosp. 11 TaxID=1416808 RepID=A0A261UER2_9BORD|nr:LysR family transcriptional regulator [Bordetella genomosp. 11]OZI60428.1 LysR family transcriptional regulator [Bordetella genomosp. 11]
MNFDLADLRAFVAASDHGSFRAAAEILCISQSALSRRIEKLENALGLRLFERTTRRLELTTAGRGFVHKARHVLNELESALLGTRDLADRMSGEVTIACVPSAVAFFLPRVIKAYHDEYPRIRLRIRDETSAEILTTVARSEADFGLTYIGTQEPDVEFEPLIEDPFVLACSREHPLARKRKVRWAELADHDYIAVAQGSGNRMLIDQALANTAALPRWFCEVQHVPALVSLVEAGVGVGVVPKLGMPQLGHATLVSVPLVDPPISRTLGLIRRRGRALSAAAQRLYDVILQSHL